MPTDQFCYFRSFAAIRLYLMTYRFRVRSITSEVIFLIDRSAKSLPNIEILITEDALTAVVRLVYATVWHVIIRSTINDRLPDRASYWIANVYGQKINKNEKSNKTIQKYTQQTSNCN